MFVSDLGTTRKKYLTTPCDIAKAESVLTMTASPA
jgi:hypothetical protein